MSKHGISTAVAILALALARLAPPAAAHSHVPYIIINGQHFSGYDPKTPSWRAPPGVVGWSAENADDGFVGPADYASPDIVCHRGAVPARAHAPVRAGDRVHVQWNGWPQSHVGPVLSYLAPCPAASSSTGCAGVDASRLRFVKIDDGGPALLAPSPGAPAGSRWNASPYTERGVWATDVLIASNNSWLVEIPRGLRTGAYVLRHEIIALHFAKEKGGAQNYPQCINLWVTAGEDTSGAGTSGGDSDMTGDEEPRGIAATEMYHSGDPGIEIDIYDADRRASYIIPGPGAAIDAAPVPWAQQKNTQPTALATGTAVWVVGQSTTPVPAGRRFGG